MSRSRKAPTNLNHTDTKESNTMSNLFVELDDSEVTETQGQTRSRGDYDVVLSDFLAAGIKGARIPAEGILEGRKAPAMKSGLEGAVRRMEKNEAGSGAGIKVVLFKAGTGDSATEEIRLLNANAGQ